MKKIIFLLASVIFSLQAFSQANNYNVGDVVNDFTVTDTDGVEHNLYSLIDAGKYVYLDFFFDTCGPCQNNQPTFNEFIDRYGCNMGDVYGLSINDGTDNDAEVIAYVNTYGGPWVHPPAASREGGSEAVTDDFGVGAFPTFVLIGPDYKLLEKDIWPLNSGVGTFEATFPTGFNPPQMPCSILDIEDQEAVSFSIYPNPSNGTSINLRLSNFDSDTEIKIYSMLGKLVHSSVIVSREATITTNLSAGTYIVQVLNDQGTATSSLIVK